MMMQTPCRWLLAGGALAALMIASPTAQAGDNPAQTAPSPVALSAAKTIQVKETFFVADRVGQVHPYFNVVVQIERPGKVRIEAALVPGARPDAKTARNSLYLSDGTTQYEYNGFTNKYTTSAAPAPGERSASQLYDMAGIQLLLYPGQPPRAKAGVRRTVGTDTLDGKTLTVTTDTQPTRKGRDGAAFTVSEKLWADAKTGLPFRRTQYITQGGKMQSLLQLDFTDWTLNQPIPAAQFAWMPPAGAVAYVEPKLLSVGTPAPDFAALAPDGKTVHLSDYKGKPVVLDFWATWCGPCQQSMPHLESVYKQIKSKGVSVLAVCVWDEKDAYDKWIVVKKTTYSFPTAFDPAGRGDKSIAGSLYGVSGIPTQYVIDKDGKVAAVNVGYEEGDHQLETALAKLGVDVAVPQKQANAAK